MRGLIIVGVLALLASACGSSATNAFVITDRTGDDDVELPTIEVSESSVDDQLEAISGNDEFVAFLEESGSTVRGDGVAGLDPAYVAQFVTDLVVFSLIGAEVDERDLAVTDDDRAAGEDDLATRLGGGDAAAGAQLLTAMPASYKQFLVDAFSGVAVLQADIGGAEPSTDAELQAFYDDNPDQFEQACGAHILISSVDEAGAPLPQAEIDAAQEQAEGIKAFIEAGADFAEVAEAESDDVGSGAEGGDLGCAGRGQFVPEFEEALFGADPGELVGPIETQFGFHVIRLDELRQLSFEEARAQIEQQLAPETDEFATFVQGQLQAADVVVLDKYGTWNAEAARVEPPVDDDSPATSLTVPPDATLPPAETVPAE